MTKHIFNYILLLLICISQLSCSSESNKSGGSNDTYNYLKENFKSPDANSGVRC
jgi:hypothetical protein